MARERSLKIVIAGDSDKLNKELRKANSHLDKFGKQTRVTSSITSKGFAGMRVAAVGAGAAIGGLAIAGRSFVNAALEAEKSQTRLRTQLKASGLSYATHSAAIERSIQATSRLAALDDEDLQDAFSGIVRVSGDVNKSLRLTALAADIARGRNIELSVASKAVERAAGGSTLALGRMVGGLKSGASSSEVLAAAQRKFAGQAEAFGRSNAGGAARAAIAYEELKETIGGALAPAVGDISNKFARFVTQMQTGTGQGGRFVEKLRAMWEEARPVVSAFGRAAVAVGRFTAKHPELVKLAAGVVAVGTAIRAMRFVSAVSGFSALLKAGRGATSALRRIFASGGTAAGEAAAVGTASSYTQGSRRFGRVGRSAGQRIGRGLIIGVVTSAATFAPEISDLIVKSYAKVTQAAIKLGKHIVRNIVRGVGVAGGAVGSAITKLFDKINPFGDGIGKFPAMAAGKGSASLQGASSALAPIAAVGRRFGLGISSGKFGRETKRTSTGNISYHSTGEAIDLSGSAAGMMRTFRALKSTMGGRLAELIYTPGGTGVKNGRPHRYSGKVAADHYDHVHVALDLGRPGPGIGDGIGEAVRAGRAAGFKGRELIELVAIAGPESNYRNKARLVTSREDSRGMWQINTLAHPWARSLNLSNPVVAARAARKVWEQAGRSWSPWTGYTSGAYRSFVDDARRAVAGSRGSAGRAAPARRATSTPSGGGERVNPFELATAEADLAIADAERGRTIKVGSRRIGPELQQLQAVSNKRALIASRIRKIRARLAKRGVGRAEKLRLTTELTQLLGEHRELGGRISEIKAGPERDDATADVGGDAGDTPSTADVQRDMIDRNLSDLELMERAGVITPEQARAMRVGNIQQWLGGALGPLEQRQQWELMAQLKDAQQEQTQATSDLASEMKALREETARANAIAESTLGTQMRELTKAFADLVSGQIGYKTGGRMALAGSGALARYAPSAI